MGEMLRFETKKRESTPDAPIRTEQFMIDGQVFTAVTPEAGALAVMMRTQRRYNAAKRAHDANPSEATNKRLNLMQTDMMAAVVDAIDSILTADCRDAFRERLLDPDLDFFTQACEILQVMSERLVADK